MVERVPVVAVDPHEPLRLALLERGDVVVAVDLFASVSTDAEGLTKPASHTTQHGENCTGSCLYVRV